MAIKKIVKIIRGNLSLCFVSPRFYIALILAGILFQQIEGPIRTLCAQTGYSITPWLFPHLTSLYYIQNIVTLGVVLIFCDAPFIKNNTPYTMIRTGRSRWFAAQVGYIAAVSLIYCLFLYFISIILILPYLKIDMGWGKIIGTLAQTDAASQIGTVKLEYQMIIDFKPWQALLGTCGMSCLVFIFTGLLMMCINIFGHQYLGPIAGAAVAFTPYLARIFSNMYTGYYFSPPTWMSMMVFGKNRLSPYPTIRYAIVFLIAGIIVLIVSSYCKFRKQAVEIMTIIN
ncbi:hypothetical protein LQE92_12455 [Lacrimispora sp. NSJ-141]|uniref:Uncharacterized protein n=1 Tax=Lientehia hominis TaxID=2897778 RepID=A0AAP2RK72_9FIRM|nr:hypothetical protein [Lientehia hominis]MCD2493426.1 hypothetical protein [Lientehia hominis]